MRKTRTLVLLALLLVLAAIPTSSNAAVSQGQLQTICQGLYGGVFDTPNPEPFGACQWDMAIIGAGSSYEHATGEGVSVGVIDSGVDPAHPDIAPNLDLARSCSFIFTGTPTADPQEIANGNCTNKAAVAGPLRAWHTRRVGDRGARERNRCSRRSAGRDNRRHQGMHGRGILLRRLGGGRAALRRRPRPRRRQPQLVRRSLSVLLQERRRAARDAARTGDRGPLRTAARGRDRRLGRKRASRSSPPRHR